MKKILTMFLFAVCIVITMLIVKIDEYSFIIVKEENYVGTGVNNKVENKDINNVANNKEDNEIIDVKENNNEINNNEKQKEIHDVITNLKHHMNLSFSNLDKQIMIKTKNSSYIPWNTVIYQNTDMAYKLFNNGNQVEWIEVENKSNIFGRDLNSFNNIKDFLGNDEKVMRVKNEEFKYEYYLISYELEGLKIRFISYYEDGSKNVCVITRI